MLATLAALALLAQEGPAFTMNELRSPNGHAPRLMYRYDLKRLDQPKIAPQKFGADGEQWQFDWLTAAYAKSIPTDDRYVLKFRVFSQDRKSEGDLAPQVSETLIRLFDYVNQSLGLDHKQDYHYGIVDVYLCWGGKAGGEQLFGEDSEGGTPHKVNTIYIYDLASFKDPVEKVREVAHEYGHAILPAVGGFSEPEDWANGYLGEKLFITHLRDGMAKGWWGPECTMQATKSQLDSWIAANVQPLVTHAATTGPEAGLLASKGQDAMNAYMGLALYSSAVLPSSVLARSMKLIGSVRAVDYPSAIVMAAQELESFRLTIPGYLAGKSIWVPLGRGAVSGATALKRSGDWVLIKPGTGPVTVIPKRPTM